MIKEKKVELLIIGAGIAGLSAALYYAKHGKVLVVCKEKLNESNSHYAQGGIAAAMSKFDSPTLHYEDTLKAGHNHNLPEAVMCLSEEAPARILDLINWGIHFDKKGDDYDLAIEGAHSEARVLHYKDYTGQKIIEGLHKQVKSHPNIELIEQCFTEQLLSHGQRCVGAVVYKNNEYTRIQANFSILATGGAGQLFPHTSNPQIATGDGYSLAYQAGCSLSDLEFIQFHPTTLACKNGKSFLLSEALRGAGAQLVTEDGEALMKDISEKGDLAPRDLVAKRLYEYTAVQKKQVFLDCSAITKIEDEFPMIYSVCLENGYDLKRDQIPVNPAAHYMMGGVLTDLNAKTSLNNLYAIGEVACTGVHGANRLASNSLVEGVVFAYRAIQDIQKQEKPLQANISNDSHNNKERSQVDVSIKELQALVYECLGITRHKVNLEKGYAQLQEWLSQFDTNALEANRERAELKHLIQLAILICDSALKRQESLGCHNRSDSKKPSTDKYWILQQKGYETRCVSSFPTEYSLYT